MPSDLMPPPRPERDLLQAASGAAASGRSAKTFRGCAGFRAAVAARLLAGVVYLSVAPPALEAGFSLRGDALRVQSKCNASLRSRLSSKK